MKRFVCLTALVLGCQSTAWANLRDSCDANALKSCLQSNQSEDNIGEFESCLSQAYMCGEYSVLLKTDINLSDLPEISLKHLQYFQGAAAYGNAVRQQAIELRCNSVGFAKQQLNKFLTTSSEEFRKTRSFGGISAVDRVNHATSILKEIDRDGECADRPLTQAEAVAISNLKAKRMVDSFFIRDVGSGERASTLLNAKSEYKSVLKGLVTDVSDSTTQAELKATDLAANKRRAQKIFEDLNRVAAIDPSVAIACADGWIGAETSADGKDGRVCIPSADHSPSNDSEGCRRTFADFKLPLLKPETGDASDVKNIDFANLPSSFDALTLKPNRSLGLDCYFAEYEKISDFVSELVAYYKNQLSTVKLNPDSDSVNFLSKAVKNLLARGNALIESYDEVQPAGGNTNLGNLVNAVDSAESKSVSINFDAGRHSLKDIEDLWLEHANKSGQCPTAVPCQGDSCNTRRHWSCKTSASGN